MCRDTRCRKGLVKIAQKWVLQSQQDSAFVEHQLCPAQLDDIFSDRVLQSVYIVGGHLPDYSHFTESSTTHNLQKFVVVEIIERRTAVNGAGVAGEHHGIGYVGRGTLGFLGGAWGRNDSRRRLASSGSSSASRVCACPMAVVALVGGVRE